MTPVGLVHAALAAEGIGLLALGLAALAGGRALARRRTRRLLGARAPVGGRAADALLAFALAALALALLGPHAGFRKERVPATGVDVVLLFDVSQSMRAADVPPSRLERARALAEGVLAGLRPGDRAALAAFAGRGVLLTPLTPDRSALRELLPAVDETLMSERGSNFDLGVRAAITAFRAESARPRVLLLLSDGEDAERRDAIGLEAIAPLGVRVVAVGFGSEAGAPVPVQGGLLADAEGRPISSRADYARLLALADPTGGALYRSDRFGRVDGASVLAAVRRDAARGTDGFVERRVPRSVAPWFAAVALLALLAEASLARRRRDFAAWYAPGSRGGLRHAPALALAALALLQLGAAEGGPTADRAALEEQLRRTPDDARALLRLGIARAEENALPEAERAFFAAATRAKEDAVAGDAYFDLGVAALGRNDLEAARDAFFDAIALAPGDREAQWNLEWTLRALALRPPPADRGGKPEQEKQERKESGEGDPDEDAAGEPEAAPQPGEETPSEREQQGEPTRENPVTLDPAAAKRWLDSVADDPGRALQAAARSSKRTRGARSGGKPLW